MGSLQTVIPAGATAGDSVCVTVSLVDDNLLEENGESFSIRLRSENAERGLAILIVSITDDDGN